MQTPTLQQREIAEVFQSGESLCIFALAGTGKTSTLKLLSDSCTSRKGVYIAFNRRIANEARLKFANLDVSTIHGMAYGWARKFYDKERLARSIDRAIIYSVETSYL